MRAGGGLMFDDVTVDTWLNTSSRLMGGTPFFPLLFLDFPLPLDALEFTEGDFGGEFMARYPALATLRETFVDAPKQTSRFDSKFRHQLYAL
jgi:hypothetical protein